MVILVAFLAKTGNIAGSSIQKSQAKVLTINSFVRSFDSIVGRALQASSKQAIVSSEDYMSQNPTKYIPDFQNEFKEIIYRGQYPYAAYPNGNNLTKMSQLNIQNTLYIVQGVAKDNNIVLTHDPIQPADISIQHISPWEIEVTLNLKNVVVSDNEVPAQREVVWNLGDKTIKTKLYVTDFSDPFTLKELGEDLPIKKHTQLSFGQKSELDAFIASQSFIAHGDGSNFLQRMAGVFTNDVNGIERVLDSSRGTDSKDTKSFVDYYYFGDFNDNQASCKLEGYPGNFVLDDKHKIYYTTSPC